jgi:hypothetical protein
MFHISLQKKPRVGLALNEYCFIKELSDSAVHRQFWSSLHILKTLYLFLAPEGVAPPSVAVVSETTIRVSWVAPLKPNGQIIGYFIHVINNKIPNNPLSVIEPLKYNKTKIM